jgi:hypothetical protein
LFVGVGNVVPFHDSIKQCLDLVDKEFQLLGDELVRHIDPFIGNIVFAHHLTVEYLERQ